MPYNAAATEALFDAINRGAEADALKALQDGADPNATRGGAKNSPLILCALYHKSGVTNALLECGADPDYRRDGGETALMMCGLSNDRKTAKLIVDAGASILLQDNANRDAVAHCIQQSNRGLGDLIRHWAEEYKVRISAEKAEAGRRAQVALAESERLAAELRQNIADTIAVTADGLHTPVSVKRPLKLKAGVHA